MALSLALEVLIKPGRKMFVITGFTNVAVSTKGSAEKIDLEIGSKYNILQVGATALGCTDFDFVLGQAEIIDFVPSVGGLFALYQNVNVPSQVINQKVGSDVNGLIFTNQDAVPSASVAEVETDNLYIRLNNNDASNIITGANTYVFLVIDY